METLEPLAKLIEKYGLKITGPTRVSWVKNGIKTKSGDRVQLEARRIAGRYYSKPSWVTNFFDKTNTLTGGKDA
jgi:hypothetical protein